MPSSIRLALAAVLVGTVCVGAQGPAPLAPAASANTAIVTGRVVAGDGKTAVAAATVALAAPGRGSLQAERVLTDAQGRFFFVDVPAGRYNLTASKPGWIDGSFGSGRPGGSSTPLEVEAGGRHPNVTLQIWQYATISGRVVDETGEPMVGVDVRAYERRYVAGRPTYLPAGTRLVASGNVTGLRSITDDRGMYRFSNLLPGDYIVAVPATVTTEPASIAGALRSGDTAYRTYLQTMSAVGTAPMFLERAQAITPSDRWLVSSLVSIPVASGAPDRTSMAYQSAFHPAAATVESAAIVRAVSGQDQSGTDIAVRLATMYQVSGTLTVPEGSAAFHAIHLVPAGASENPPFDIATAVTDEAGAFLFEAVPPGAYIARMVRTPWPTGGLELGIAGGTGAIRRVMTFGRSPTAEQAGVSTEPLLSAEVAVVVANQSVRNVMLAARPGGRVTGRAAFEGTAPPPSAADWRRIAVNLDRANGQGSTNIQAGQFSEDGRFETPSTWPGRYLVRIANAPTGWFVKSVTSQGRDVSDTPFDLSGDLGDVVVTFTDRVTKVEGTVQSADGKAGPGSMVLLFPANTAAWVDYGRTSSRMAGAPSGTNGAFSFPSVPEGEYFLLAVSDADADDWQNPAFLKRLAPLAERIQVTHGQTLTRILRRRTVQ